MGRRGVGGRGRGVGRGKVGGGKGKGRGKVPFRQINFTTTPLYKSDP